MASATKNAVCRVSLDDCKKAAATKTKEPVTVAAPRRPDAPTASATGEPNGLQPQIGSRSGPIRASREGSRGTEVDWDPWTNAPKHPEQLADEAALAQRPYGQLAAQWLRDQGIVVDYLQGLNNTYDENRKILYIGTWAPPKDRVEAYEKVIKSAAGMPDEEQRPDAAKMSLEQYLRERRDYEAQLYSAEANLVMQKRKLKGGAGVSDSKYQKAYMSGYDHAIKREEVTEEYTGPLSDRAKQQIGERGGYQEVYEELIQYKNDQFVAEWKKANPPAQRRWYCAWAWHCG